MLKKTLRFKDNVYEVAYCLIRSADKREQVLKGNNAKNNNRID